MAEEYTQTVRIRRPSKVTTDERGRTVWADTVETAELELVSTAEMKKILAASDETTRTAIEQIVSSDQEGVLARDVATGLFEIISDADLQKILESDGGPPKTFRPADVTLERAQPKDPGNTDELSLVSTQVLRRILASDKPGARTPGRPGVAPKTDKGGGFDPYNSG